LSAKLVPIENLTINASSIQLSAVIDDKTLELKAAECDYFLRGLSRLALN
jgi:hypothetical protein